MKHCCLFLLLCCALPAFGLAGGMERATVFVMRKVPCEDAGSGRGMTAGMSGAIPMGPNTSECLEYELHTKKVSYLIHPHKQVLLMVGEEVMIRLAVSELIVSSPGLPKEVRCSVLSMELLTEAEKNAQRERNRPLVMRCYDNGRDVPCPRDY